MKKTKAQKEAQQLLESLTVLQEAVVDQVKTATEQLQDLLGQMQTINKDMGSVLGSAPDVFDKEIEDILDKHWKGYE